MRTTVAIEDELLHQAEQYSGIKERAALIRHALVAYVQAEAANRLAALGGSMPHLEAPPRRRSEA